MKPYLFLLSLFAATFMSCSSEEYFVLTGLDSANYIIAHRGDYEQNGYPENSRASFQSALSLDIYGVEFDVRQTKDHVLVICHDKEFDGVIISEATYSEIEKHLLSNGETLPTLEDFLQIYKNSHSKVSLIVELKLCSVSDVVGLIEQYALQESSEYISFNLDYCDQLVNLGYGSKVSYLDGTLTPIEVKERGYAGIDYSVADFTSNPEWIPEAKSLGLKVGVWTVDNTISMLCYIDNQVIVTTNKAWMCARNNTN